MKGNGNNVPAVMYHLRFLGELTLVLNSSELLHLMDCVL